jgi:hypothetical protein
VHARAKFVGQGLVYHAVAINPRPSPESLRDDPDAEVAFAIGMAAGMSGMLIAFVNNIKYDRLEGRSELPFERQTDRA